MNGSVINPAIKQGETVSATRIPVSSRGEEYLIKNRLTADGEPRDGRSCRVVLVKNASGGALLPGRGVIYKAGAYGWEIAGYNGAAGRADGYVDHTLPAAGVADGYAFLMTIEGPVYAWTDGANALAIRDRVVGAANGYITLQTAAPASDTATLAQANAVVGDVEDTTIAATVDLRPWIDVRCRK